MPPEVAPSTAGKPWICPGCDHAVSTPFCSTCGEEPASERDLTLLGFLGHFVRGLTSVDGRLIRSFRCLARHPGTLTVAYLRGQRKAYSSPLKVFFLANLVFLAFHLGTEAKVLSAPLESHLHTQPWSPMAERLVQDHLTAAHMTLESYTPSFNKAVASHAKTLIILMIVPFALIPPVLFRRNRSPFVAHAVFSLHFYAFVLLLFCVARVALGLYAIAHGSGHIPDPLDHAVALSLLLGFAAYLHASIGTVYGARGAMRAAAVLALTVAAAATVLGYRFALLLITLYCT